MGSHPTCCAQTRKEPSLCRCEVGLTIPTMARAPTNRETTVLLLHGEERFLVVEAANSTLDRWKSELVSDFGFETLEGTGLTTARLPDSILQAPFLAPCRAAY